MKKKNIEIREKILKGLDISSKKLVKSKKDRNLKVVVSDKGKVVKLNPRNAQKLALGSG